MSDFSEGWPLDSDGRPMARISFSAKDKIGLPNYSNIEIGPVTITAYAPWNRANPFTASELANVASGITQIAETVEAVLAEQRGIVLDSMDPKPAE
jgi:hypothetical protein